MPLSTTTIVVLTMMLRLRPGTCWISSSNTTPYRALTAAARSSSITNSNAAVDGSSSTVPRNNNNNNNDDLFSVAPMMEYTDRHLRYLLRLLSRRSKLYTEMVTASTLVHNDEVGRWLDYNDAHEHPVVLQVGGSDAGDLRGAVRRALPYGYDEINLNCGCPSEKVAGKGCFGAALMKTPELVRDCVPPRAEIRKRIKNNF